MLLEGAACRRKSSLLGLGGVLVRFLAVPRLGGFLALWGLPRLPLPLRLSGRALQAKRGTIKNRIDTLPHRCFSCAQAELGEHGKGRPSEETAGSPMNPSRQNPYSLTAQGPWVAMQVVAGRLCGWREGSIPRPLRVNSEPRLTNNPPARARQLSRP